MKYIFFFLALFCSVKATLQVTDTIDVRCNTVQYNNQLIKQFPNIGTKENFEDWMKKELEKLRHNNGNRMVTTYTIPIIFHIIHNGQAVGATQNVSAAYINAQISQMNIDFANMAGSTHSAAADTEIQFCAALVDPSNNVLTEPGIHRVHRNTFSFSTPPWSDTYVDNTIKPASIWNPDLYFNVWVLDITGGILGWAQFPEAATLGGIGINNGSANTDGVVILYSSVGSMALPFNNGNGQYDNGRTLTHEAGHWLGLRHIWGDGGCSVDDYCADTPLAASSNFNCPNINSCNDGNPNPPDMVENYMDYTDDNCMNIFTGNQKSRMHVVMGATGNPSPRRAILNSSTVCNSDPCFSFSNSALNISELSDCQSNTINVGVNLNVALPTDVTVTLAISGSSTATLNQDYTISSNTLVFTAGFIGVKNIVVTVKGDAIIEGNENIIFNISSIAGTTAGACNANPSTLTITDNDQIILGSVSNYVFLNENFNITPSNWTVVNGGSNAFTWETSTLFGTSSLNGSNFAFCNSDAAGSGSTTYETLLSPVINTESATTLSLQFDQYFRRLNGGYAEKVTVDVWNGSAWINVYTRTQSNGTIGAWNAPNTQTINILAHKNNAMQLRFIYDAAYDWWWAIDNVKVTGNSVVTPQTAINSSSGYDEQLLGPNQTVYFNDKNTGKIMMKIENLTNHDYGCTRIEVDKSGNSYFTAGQNGNNIADKTYKITPTSNTPSGLVNITTYYQNSELAPWTTNNNEGCESISALSMISSVTPINTTTGNFEYTNTTRTNYNTTDHAFSANVSGLLSGIGLSDQIKGAAIYVKHNATGNQSGGSFENGMLNLVQALQLASTCSNINEIRISKGTYKPALNELGMVPSSTTDATYYINQNMNILGSFEGISTSPDVTNPSLRNFVTNPTIFSGDHNDDDGMNIFTDNSKTIVKISPLVTSFVLDGINIERGKGIQGCGIYCGGSLMLKNAGIRYCTASVGAAAIFMTGAGTLTMESCIFENNSPDDIQGAPGSFININQNVTVKD